MAVSDTIPCDAPRSNWVLEGFEAFERQLNGSVTGPWHTLRAEALKSFGNLGFPSPAQEEWKYTNVSPIAKGGFSLLPPPERSSQHMEITSAVTAVSVSQSTLVFVNGSFVEELSSVPDEGLGVKCISFAQIFDGSLREPELLRAVDKHLAKLASAHEHAFIAINTAFLRNGAVIYVPKNTRVESALQLLFLNGSAEQAAMVYPRVLVVAEENSEVTIVETYAALSENRYFTNQVTEIAVAPGAHVDHYKVQCEAESAYHYGAICAAVERDCEFRTHSFSFGGQLVRSEVYPVLNGEGSSAVLNGLSVLRQEQHVDNSTVIDHAKPHCESHELYKGVYADKSAGVFSGTIIVRPDAQKTNALQTNQSLLLSANATVDARPQLKIWADDVKCTHGATVGQLDEDALFYLRSRGVRRDDARTMLIHAFASDVISGVRIPALRTWLEERLVGKLKQIGAVENDE